MSEFDTVEALQKPTQPERPKQIKVLTLSIALGEDAGDIGEIASAASKLGEIRSLNVGLQYDYGDDYLY